MYNDLWDACYALNEPVRAEAILGAVHRLLAVEGGEKEVVIATAMLSTVEAGERAELLNKYVDYDLHGEINGILESDPENKNTAIVHDAILLSRYHKNLWKKTEEDLEDLEELIPAFRTNTARNDAKDALAMRKNDFYNKMPLGAQKIGSASGASSESVLGEELNNEQSEPNSMTQKVPVGVQKENSSSEKKVYHWADQTAKKIIEEKGNKELYTIAAGITPSGVIHFGNFREIITNDLIVKALQYAGKKVRFIYSWDDYDTFRKIPKNMPDQEKLKEYLFRPTVEVPDPFDCKHDNYADHFKAEIMEDLPLVGVFPEFIHQNKKYRACEYAEDIRHALLHRKEIREILNDFKTDEIGLNWWPLAVYCEECGRDRTTQVTAFDGEYAVSYQCECGHKGTFDLRKKGIAKLPWRVDWPMRWHKEQVDFEPGGKDHSSQGGSFDTGRIISKKIWNYEAPTYIMYDFINFKGQGGKMSSSAGNTVTLRTVLEIYSPELVRFMFAGTRPDAEFSVSFDVDVFKMYEDFETVERKYFGTDEVKNEKDEQNARRIYELSMISVPEKQPVQPSFRHLTTYVQIARGDLDKVVGMMRSEIHSEQDEARVRERARCAWNWVKNYAPEQYRFELGKEPYKTDIPQKEKNALIDLANILANQDETTLTEIFHQLCEKHGIQSGDFFKQAYLVLVGKERGPRLANFITQSGHENIAKVLKQLE